MRRSSRSTSQQSSKAVRCPSVVFLTALLRSRPCWAVSSRTRARTRGCSATSSATMSRAPATAKATSATSPPTKRRASCSGRPSRGWSRMRRARGARPWARAASSLRWPSTSARQAQARRWRRSSGRLANRRPRSWSKRGPSPGRDWPGWAGSRRTTSCLLRPERRPSSWCGLPGTSCGRSRRGSRRERRRSSSRSARFARASMINCRTPSGPGSGLGPCATSPPIRGGCCSWFEPQRQERGRTEGRSSAPFRARVPALRSSRRQRRPAS